MRAFSLSGFSCPCSVGSAHGTKCRREAEGKWLQHQQPKTWITEEPSTFSLGPRSSRKLLLPLGTWRWPQLPRPVGKRAAVSGQSAAIGVVGEEPAEAGFESLREQPALGF